MLRIPRGEGANSYAKDSKGKTLGGHIPVFLRSAGKATNANSAKDPKRKATKGAYAEDPKRGLEAHSNSGTLRGFGTHIPDPRLSRCHTHGYNVTPHTQGALHDATTCA